MTKERSQNDKKREDNRWVKSAPCSMRDFDVSLFKRGKGRKTVTKEMERP